MEVPKSSTFHYNQSTHKQHIHHDATLDNIYHGFYLANQRRIVLAIRTAYTTAICIYLSTLWAWGGEGTFLSPVISSITGIYLYIGNWQVAAWRVLASVFIGSSFGILAGYCKKYPPLQLLIMFVGVTYSNRCSVWDHPPKVYATLVIVLGTLWPLLQTFEVPTLQLYKELLLIIYVPFLVTLFTLAIPFPATTTLATTNIIKRMAYSFGRTLEVLTHGFYNVDAKDINVIKYNSLHNDLESDITELGKLCVFADHEAIILPWLADRTKAIRVFISQSTVLLNELAGLRDMLKNIRNNKTQALFAENMITYLDELTNEVCEAFDLIEDRFDYSNRKSNGYSNIIFRNIASFIYGIFNLFDWNTQNKINSLKISFEEIICRLGHSRNLIVQSFAFTRQQYIREQIKLYHADITETVDNSDYTDYDIFSSYGNETYVSMKRNNPNGVSSIQSRERIQNMMGSESTKVKMNYGRHSVSKHPESYDEEYRYIRNLSPRAAYIHRLCQIVEIMSSMKQVFEVKATPLSLYDFISETMIFLCGYVMDGVNDLRIVFKHIIDDSKQIIHTIYTVGWDWNKISKVINTFYWQKGIEVWAPSIKIALSIVLASIIVVVSQSREYLLNAVWAPITISWIRQEISSTAFLLGYQRLEGTAIGAIYAFSLYQGLDCPNSSCTSITYRLPVIVIWLGFCAFFREGPRHGYAALVAGFTPIVLLLGPATGSILGAWSRVQMTFIGVAIFLSVDHLILPSRADDSIRQLVVSAIDECSSIFAQSLLAVRCLTADKESLIQLKSKDTIALILSTSEITSNRSAYHDLPTNNETKDTTASNMIATNTMYSRIGSCSDNGNSNNEASNNSTHPIGKNMTQDPSSSSPIRSLNWGISGVFDSQMLFDNNNSDSSIPNIPSDSKRNSISISFHKNDTRLHMSEEYEQKRPDHRITQNKSELESEESNMDTLVSSSDTTSISNTDVGIKFNDIPNPKSNSSIKENTLPSVTNKIVTFDKQSRHLNRGKSMSVESNKSINSSSKRKESIISVESVGSTNESEKNLRQHSVNACRGHLELVENNLNLLTANLLKQKTFLDLVGNEPNIFSIPFPQHSYEKLLRRFQSLLRTGYHIFSGTAALNNIISNIMSERRGSIYYTIPKGREDIEHHIQLFTFFNERLFLIIADVVVALSDAAKAVKQVLERSEYNANMESLLTLPLTFEQIVKEMDEHFIHEYVKITIDAVYDIRFLLAWKNVFESVCNLVKSISEVGLALHYIQNVESLNT